MIPDPEQSYQPHQLRQLRPDGSFKYREIMKPSDETREVHERMLRFFYSLDIPMPYATGGVPGRRLIDNALPHRDNDYFYMLDLKDAFRSVDIDVLVGLAKTPLVPKRYEFDVETFILDWATTPLAKGLPLGAPCSPHLFNLYCLPMDRALGRFCESAGLTYTRYLDDLTFSSKSWLDGDCRSELRDLIEETPGMRINHRKGRLHSLRNGPVTITGMSLQPDRRIQPCPQLLEAARTVFADSRATVDAGGTLSDEEIGRLHGWYGTLRQLSASETPVLRRLGGQYRAVLGRIGLKGYEAEESGQLVLFNALDLARQ